VSRYQKGKTNLDFTEARDSEWQWNLLEHMQVCTSLQTDNHASTPPLSFLQAGCPSCRPTNSVGASIIKQKSFKTQLITAYFKSTQIVLRFLPPSNCRRRGGHIVSPPPVRCFVVHCKMTTEMCSKRRMPESV